MESLSADPCPRSLRHAARLVSLRALAIPPGRPAWHAARIMAPALRCAAAALDGDGDAAADAEARTHAAALVAAVSLRALGAGGARVG